jgi:SAM-dependent methyltransferase
MYPRPAGDTEYGLLKAEGGAVNSDTQDQPVKLYQRAWKSSSDVAEYELGRPGYPVEAIEFLAEMLGVDAGSTILDIGAGTGKLTRALLRLPSTVVAIEPLEHMRARFQEGLPGTLVLDGTAEALPLGSQRVQAIFAGQSWHWFDGNAALGEAERVLKPAGGVGLLWNEYDESELWMRELAGLRDESSLSSPSGSTMEWRRAFDRRAGWSELAHSSFPHRQTLSPEQLVARVTSSSVIAALPANQRSHFAARVVNILQSHESTRDRTQIVVPYRAQVFWARYRS